MLAIPLWLLSFPETTIRHQLKPFWVYGSQVMALTGFAMFALTFVLSARIKWMEDYFGGLDKMYQLHHTMAKTALLLLLVHPVMLAVRFLPVETDRILWYLFPVHRRFEVNLGSWALWGLVILMLITLAIKIPYDKWKISHKFMGIFFIFGISHVYLMGLSVAANPALTVYLAVLSIVGVTAWIYKSILFNWVTKRYQYRVENTHRMTDHIIEITMVPENERIQFIPGQFFFFSFQDSGLSRESHPFTVCSETEGSKIKIMVKVLGDYTRQLHQNLKPGAVALLEGPYGRFDYRHGRKNQVWIGGGVGIAPFISWANDLKKQGNPNYNITLYYCVKTEREATHLQLFKELESTVKDFSVYLIREDIEGFLSTDQIAGVKVNDFFICGPKLMRETLVTELKKKGITNESIHYEDFDFT